MFMGLTSSYYHIWEAKRARKLGQGNINLIINTLVYSQKYDERDNLLDLFLVLLFGYMIKALFLSNLWDLY